MDEDIRIGIAAKSRVKIEEHGIRTENDLLAVKSRIESGELSYLREEVRKKLIKVAEWRSCNLDVDIIQGFDEDVFEEFCNSKNETSVSEYCDSKSMDSEMKHICKVIGVLNSNTNLAKVEEYGLHTIKDLEALHRKEGDRVLSSLRPDIKRGLFIVSKWLCNNKANIKSIRDEFTHSLYDDLWMKEERADFAEKYISVALGRPYCEENQLYFKDVEEDKELFDEVLRQVKNAAMVPYLKENCGNFDYDAFLDTIITHLHKLVGQPQYAQRRIFINGDTQSGKTIAGIAIPQSLCGLLKIIMVVLTKGVDESIDLTDKLKDSVLGTSTTKERVIVASSKRDKMNRYEKDARIEHAFDGRTHSGTLVIADTEPQVMRKACKHINLYRERVQKGLCILVEDEADAMYRTPDRRQKFEQAHMKLQDHMCAVIHLSATPLPLMIDMVLSGKCEKEDIDFIRFEPHDTYISVEDLKPLEIKGNKILLEQNEVTCKSSITRKGVSIGWANSKFLALYDDAVSHSKGVLVLDISCPRVNVSNNIQDKGAAIQKMYLKRGKPIISITFSGKGIHVKLPPRLATRSTASRFTLRNGDDIQIDQAKGEMFYNTEKIKWTFSQKTTKWQIWVDSLIGGVIECMDELFGLEIPIFVFGYTKMRRGISFRSTHRVPTHMVLSLGRGYSISSLCQSAGRANGNGKKVLEENGFTCVTILATADDLIICNKMRNYLREVGKRMQAEETFAEAVTGANKDLPDEANFLRHTFRKLGQIPGLREQFEEIVNFEALPKTLSKREKELRDKYWKDSHAQMLLRSLIRLGSSHSLVHFDDILDDLAQMESDTYAIPGKAVLRGKLKEFVDRAFIRKDRKAWSVPTVKREIEKDGFTKVKREPGIAWLLNVGPEHEELDNNSERPIVIKDESIPSMVPTVITDGSLGSETNPIILDCDNNSMSSLSICLSPEKPHINSAHGRKSDVTCTRDKRESSDGSKLTVQSAKKMKL